MQPRQLVRASREHCAFLYAPAGARDGVTLGAMPLRPRQGTEFPARCSIVALRPIGRIARFAPHLQVAVSATGRAPFRCLPPQLKSMPPRQLVRAPREHCAFLYAPAGARVRATLGGSVPRAIPASHASERRRIFVQGKELRRWRTGGTSSRKRRSPAQKDKPSTRGDCRSCSDPGRNLRFLHLPPFALCLRYFANTGRTARSRIPFIFAIAIP